MSPARQTNHDLDELIAEVTVDAHDEDEQLMGFANAFDEVELPQPGSVIGEDVEVLSIGTANARAELIATCRRAGRTYDVALLDVNIDTTDTDTSRLIAAYRRWNANRW
jgi:hypothetical protein